MKTAARWIFTLLGAGIAPFAIQAFGLVRCGPRCHGGDDAAFCASIVVGTVFFSFMPLRRLIKLALSPIYIVALAVGLFVQGIELVCGLYQSCM